MRRDSSQDPIQPDQLHTDSAGTGPASVRRNGFRPSDSRPAGQRVSGTPGPGTRRWVAGNVVAVGDGMNNSIVGSQCFGLECTKGRRGFKAGTLGRLLRSGSRTDVPLRLIDESFETIPQIRRRNGRKPGCAARLGLRWAHNP